MKGSLAASLAFHAAILIAALVVLPNRGLEEAKPVEAIMVDITTIGDVTKKMAMSKDAEKPVDKPKSAKAEIIKKPEPTAKIDKTEVTTAKPSKPKTEPDPPPEKKVEAKPPEPVPPDSDPLKDLIKDTLKDTPEPKPEKKVEPKPEKKVEPKPDKPKPEKKKEKKAEKLDVAKLEDILNSDALVNKENDQKTTNASESTDTGTPAKGEANLQGADDQLVGTIVDALVSKVKQCWSVPPGAREANMSIRIHFALNQDGTIAGTPEVQNYTADPIFDATARSAVAALIQCQAYELPQDRYDLWKDNTLDFNPNLMFQG
jgi:outer membrane biosynthesis protein TonB